MLWRRPLLSFAAMSSSANGGNGSAAAALSGAAAATAAAATATRGGVQVLVSDPAAFARKKAKFVAEGASKLQLLCDWDYTLTSFHVNGDRGCSCHKVLETYDQMPPDCYTQAQALQSYYYPKEVDPSIPLPEKIKYMEEWVHKAHDLLLRSHFRRSLLAPAVRHANVAIRGKLNDLMALSDRAAVPFLIFSAGIADVIEEIAAQQLHHPLPPTVHIVSNRMVFEDGGKNGGGGGGGDRLVGFTEPVFHVFNKRIASVLETASYCHETDYEQRHNVLLVGDSLGDLHMSDGLAFEEILRVGFLNDRVAERLAEYQSRFDVVILGDPDLSFVVGILDEIVNKGNDNDESGNATELR